MHVYLWFNEEQSENEISKIISLMIEPKTSALNNFGIDASARCMDFNCVFASHSTRYEPTMPLIA